MDENKIIVAVCGDSFCAASTQDLAATGTGLRAHFSQILEDVYGYHVLHLAHGGFSNVAIYYQIKEALSLHADVVVYTSTWSNRLELYRDCDGPAKADFNFFSEVGLKNFYYYDPNHESTNTPYVGDSLAAIISAAASNIEHNQFFSISKQCKQAIDLYFKYLYHDRVRTEIDGWLFKYWHDQIALAGALPIDFKRPDIGQIALDFSAANPTFDTPFHTDRSTQVQIAANIHRFIDQNFKPRIKD